MVWMYAALILTIGMERARWKSLMDYDHSRRFGLENDELQTS